MVRGHRQRVGLISDSGRQAGPGYSTAIPPPELGQTCEPQGTRWYNGKLYLTSRHRGILVYDPQTKQVSTLVYTYRNQLFKGPNDLDFDAEGNLFFTDPWGTGPGPSASDHTGAVYQYSRDGVLRRVMDSGSFPNGIAVSPDNGSRWPSATAGKAASVIGA